MRFDGATGAALGTFASGGGLDGPTSFTFGPDGNLYVGSVLTDRVKRYDGTSGAFLGAVVAPGAGGISAPLFACLTPRVEFLSLTAIPSLAGVPNHLPIVGAEPGAPLLFGLGQGLRQRPLKCPGLVRPLMPLSLGKMRLIADESGRAGFRWLDPPLPSGGILTTRVAQLRNCRSSAYGIHIFL